MPKSIFVFQSLKLNNHYFHIEQTKKELRNKWHMKSISVLNHTSVIQVIYSISQDSKKQTYLESVI